MNPIQPASKPMLVSIAFHFDESEFAGVPDEPLVACENDDLSVEIAEVKRICDAIREESEPEFDFSMTT